MRQLWIGRILSGLFCFVLVPGFETAAKAQGDSGIRYSKPTMSEIAAFEAKLKDLPLPLMRYRRVYHDSDVAGDRIIHGQFAPLRSGEKPMVEALNHRPEPLKTGGCVAQGFRGGPEITYCANPGSWEPTNPEIEVLERSLKMPPKAWPLSRYVRRYAGVTSKGRRFVTGVFRLANPTDEFGKRPGVIVESEAELHLDGALGGGCLYVTMTYDPVARVARDVMCNAPR